MRKLPDSELNCMLVIWKENRAMTRSEIQDKLENGASLSATALLSFLSRLEEKGFLSVQKIKKLNYYEALISEYEYKKHDSKNILSKMYNNSIKNFMTALYDGERLEDNDIEELREFINQKANEQ
ncbi:MAG: BlaI/MecI/CopY family transcriptional regulator [Lachnospiraceae bacterium]